MLPTLSDGAGHGLEVLAISVAALLLGPLIHRAARRERVTMAALDNFVLVAVVGLVVLEIAPDALGMAGGIGFVALALGLVAPSIAEGPLRLATGGTHRAALLVAVLGMAAHAFTDGLALAGAHLGGGRSHGLEVAVIAHQLPVAVAIWWLLSPVAGAFRAALVLGLIAAATIAGYTLAAQSLPLVEPRWIGLFQALIGGLLLHVVAHRIEGHGQSEGREHPRVRIAAGVGGLAGLGLLGVLVADSSHAHAHGEGQGPSAAIFDAFLELARESAPALLLAFVLAGLVTALLPGAGVRWLGRGGPLGQSIRGLLFGLPLPLCSCAVVPVYRGLIARGVPAAAAMAFLVATPELGLDAVLLSLPLLGGPMTAARVIGATAVALAVGWWVGGRASAAGSPVGVQKDMVEETCAKEKKGCCGGGAAEALAEAAPPSGSACGDGCGDAPLKGDEGGPPLPPLGLRLRQGLRTGLVTMVDDVGPWILFGLVLAALIDPWIDAATFTTLPSPLQVGLFAVLGIPTYVCASGATPLVAVLLAGGLSPGAGLAFLITGPATNATTFGLLAQLHGRRIAVLFALAMITMAIVVGLGVDALLVGGGGAALTHEHHEEAGLLSDLALAALFGLLLLSFVRQSPRGFLGKLWELAGWGRHDHGHDHGHGHGHDHGDGDDHVHGHEHEHVHRHGHGHEHEHEHEHRHGHEHEHEHDHGHGHGHEHGREI